MQAPKMDAENKKSSCQALGMAKSAQKNHHKLLSVSFNTSSLLHSNIPAKNFTYDQDGCLGSCQDEGSARDDIGMGWLCLWW